MPDATREIIMKRIALFVDGAARAAILPYAPILVYQLMHDPTARPASLDDFDLWPEIATKVALLVALCSVGHSIGSLLWGSTGYMSERVFGALIGLVVALLAFSTGANTYMALLLFRSLASVVSGILYSRTKYCAKNACNDGMQMPVVWLLGFATTVLLGGVLFHTLRRSALFRMFSSGEWHYSICLLVCCVSFGAVVFPKCCFKASGGGDGTNLVLPMVSFGETPSTTGEGTHTGVRRRAGSQHRFASAVASPGASRVSLVLLLGVKFACSFLILKMVFQKPAFSRERLCEIPFMKMRIESNYSEMSEYFDCNSMQGDEEDQMRSSESSLRYSAAHDNRDCEIAQYKDGKCVYSDGSAAPVPSGFMRSSIPREYTQFCKGDRVKAEKMWLATQRWRIDENIWKIHSLHHKRYDVIKNAYGHILHGVTRNGFPVIYEFPGKSTLKAAFERDITLNDMVSSKRHECRPITCIFVYVCLSSLFGLRNYRHLMNVRIHFYFLHIQFHHYAYFYEFITNCACESKEVQDMRSKNNIISLERGAIVIMDLSGFSMSHLSSMVVQYIKGAGDIGSAHYPLCLKKAVIINAPFWISGAWSGVKKILPEAVRDSTVILSSNYLGSLHEFLDDDQVPREMGGSSPYALDQHPFECNLRSKAASSAVHEPVKESKKVGPEFPKLTSSSLGSVDDSKYSFDHGRQKWVLENDNGASISPKFNGDDGNDPSSGVSMALNAGKWKTQITTKSTPKVITDQSKSDNDCTDRDVEMQPLHVNTAESPSQFYFDSNFLPTTPPMSNLSRNVSYRDVIAGKILTIVSVMYGTTCAVQGALETALPLWMLVPPILGGLGYEARKSGVSIFCASMVLIFFLRSKVARGVSDLPTKAPLRAFRIGIGSEVVLLTLLAVVPAIVTTVTKKESIVVLTSTVIVVCGMAFAISLGRNGAAMLHQIACSSYAAAKSERSLLASHCENGKFTIGLGVSCEVFGALITAALFGWSTSDHRPFPFDGACIFCFAALVCAIVYTLSLSLHVNVVGDFSFEDKSREKQEALAGSSFVARPMLSKLNFSHRMPSRCNMVGEFFAVPISDMASLIEEAKWSTATSSISTRKGV